MTGVRTRPIARGGVQRSCEAINYAVVDRFGWSVGDEECLRFALEE